MLLHKKNFLLIAFVYIGMHQTTAGMEAKDNAADAAPTFHPAPIFQRSEDDRRKVILLTLQYSGIAAGIQKRWPSKLDLATWGNILSYLYGPQYNDLPLPKKLWLDIATQYRQPLSPNLFEQEIASNKILRTKTTSPNSSFFLKKIDDLPIMAIYQKETGALVNAFYPCDKAYISDDGTLLHVTHGDLYSKREAIHDLKTGLCLGLFIAKFHIWNELFINKQNQIIQSLPDGSAYVYDIPSNSPFMQLTPAQKVFLATIHQNYVDSGSIFSSVQKASLPKISKKNEMKLSDLQKTLGTFDEQSQQQIIKSYNLKIEEEKSCVIQ